MDEPLAFSHQRNILHMNSLGNCSFLVNPHGSIISLSLGGHAPPSDVGKIPPVCNCT